MKVPATERLSRLVAAIPWIAAQDGAALDDIAERFDYPRELLVSDLQDIVFYVGVPPYTPDSLIDVLVEDERVWIAYADWFARPMRLSPSESLALIAAGETALAWEQSDSDDETAGALLRGLAKLRLAVGATNDTIDVRIGEGTEATLRALRQAAENGKCADIAYYSSGRGARTERRIEPLRFFLEQGNWYVAAWCHRSDDDRIFRLDRIESISVTEADASHRSSDAPSNFAFDSATDVTISFPVARARILDGLAVTSWTETASVATVTLPANSSRWLEQLMVRLGPGSSIVDQSGLVPPADLRGAAARIADRHLDAS